MQTANDIAIVPKPVRAIVTDPPKISRFDWALRDLLRKYGDGDHLAASEAILRILHVMTHEVRRPTPDVLAETQRTLHAILTVFTSPDFIVPEKHAGEYLFHVATIANAAESVTGTSTDHWRGCVAGQKQEAFKAAVLSSPRNERQFPYTKLAEESPALASLWFCEMFKTAFAGNADRHTRARLIQLAEDMHPGTVLCRDIQEPYFLSTYLDDIEAEKHVKSVINAACKREARPIVRSGERTGKIAVASDFWMRGHSVYRTLGAYVNAIKSEYELTLIHSLREKDSLVTDGFANVIKLPYDGTRVDVSPLDGQDFDAVIYPDIGMTGWSIVLANHRIAPVQVMMTGHPASTFGAEVDYFVCGQATEENPANYSERLVPLPGFGAVHEKPSYEPKGHKKTFDGIVINCSWYGQKIIPGMFYPIRQALANASVAVKLHIFSGGAAGTRCGFAPFVRAINRELDGIKAEVFPHLEYVEYMAKMEEGDFALDCWPFGGSNTISDNLWLRKPPLVLEGDRWFGNIGPAMLRSVGMHDLIANGTDELRQLIRRMVEDDEYRESQTEKLRSVDLDSTVYKTEGVSEFAAFIHHAIDSGLRSSACAPTF